MHNYFEVGLVAANNNSGVGGELRRPLRNERRGCGFGFWSHGDENEVITQI